MSHPQSPKAGAGKAEAGKHLLRSAYVEAGHTVRVRADARQGQAPEAEPRTSSQADDSNGPRPYWPSPMPVLAHTLSEGVDTSCEIRLVRGSSMAHVTSTPSSGTRPSSRPRPCHVPRLALVWYKPWYWSRLRQRLVPRPRTSPSHVLAQVQAQVQVEAPSQAQVHAHAQAHVQAHALPCLSVS